MIHNLKIEEPFASVVWSGRKNFEVRHNDRGFQKGDEVVFQCVKNGISADHPINYEKYKITYVLSGWGIEPEFVVFGIAKDGDGE